MKRKWTILGLVAMCFAAAGCALMGGGAGAPDLKGLDETVRAVWSAKFDGEWAVVYDTAVLEYKEKIARADFLKSPKVDIKAYTIRRVEIVAPGRRGVSVADFTVNHAGFEFAFTSEEEWLWESGGWRLNLMPTLSSPMDSR